LVQRRLVGGAFFFFILKPIVMQYYILPSPVTNADDRQYILMVVKPGDEASFLAAHGHQVIARGDSIAEALMNYQSWLNSQPAA